MLRALVVVNVALVLGKFLEAGLHLLNRQHVNQAGGFRSGHLHTCGFPKIRGPHTKGLMYMSVYIEDRLLRETTIHTL